MNSNNKDIGDILAVGYVVDDDQLTAVETPTPTEGVPIESAKSTILDFRHGMLSMKHLDMIKSEVEVLENEVAKHRKNSEVFEAKT